MWKADKCREGQGECEHMRINVCAPVCVFAFMSVCSRVCRSRATRNATQLYQASCPRVQNPETCPRPQIARLPEITQLLFDPNEQIQEEATREFRKLLSIGHDPFHTHT